MNAFVAAVTEKAIAFKAKAEKYEWVDEAAFVITALPGRGCAVVFTMTGRGQENVGAALALAVDAMSGLSAVIVNLLVRVLPEVDLFKDFQRDMTLVKSYARFSIMEEYGEMTVMPHVCVMKSAEHFSVVFPV